MKTTSITVTRNFRTHNEDVYLKETRERIVEVEDGENPTEVEQIVVQDMIASFKQTYPHIKTYLNFDEVIQVNNNYTDKIIEQPALLQTFNENFQSEIYKSKGTLEEQIQSYTGTPEDFKRDWFYPASMNKKLKSIYEEKEKQLIEKYSTIPLKSQNA